MILPCLDATFCRVLTMDVRRCELDACVLVLDEGLTKVDDSLSSLCSFGWKPLRWSVLYTSLKALSISAALLFLSGTPQM